MLSRRSIFSLFAAGAAIAAGTKVQAAPSPSAINDAARTLGRRFTDQGNRNQLLTTADLTTAELSPHWHTITDPAHTHTIVDNSGRMVPLSGMSVTRRPYVCTSAQYEAGECLPTEKSLGLMFPRGMLVTGAGMPDMIADGSGALFMVDSPQGREVLESMAAPNAGKSRW